MESLYLLIPLSLIFVGIAVAIFFWAVKSGQYDDLERESERILFDDDDDGENENTTPVDKTHMAIPNKDESTRD